MPKATPSLKTRGRSKKAKRAASSYFCRICWNTSGWRHPTGEAAKLETSSFAHAHGFGFEEWLGRDEWAIDGTRYAFLQPMYKPRVPHLGGVFELVLFARPVKNTAVLVGRIHSVETLSDKDAARVQVDFQARGWHRTMIDEVARVGGDISKLTVQDQPWEQWNIRYPVDALELYEEPIPVPPDHRVHTLHRYRWSALKPDDLESLLWHG